MKRSLKHLIILIFFLISYFLTAKAESTPVIKSLNPANGSVGDEIAIIGDKFGDEKGTGKVVFYKNKEAKVISWKDKEIICEVPSKAKSGNVVVYNNENKKSNGLKFKVLTGVLSAPKGLKTENITSNTATLKWNKVEKAVGYSLTIGTDENASNIKKVNLSNNIYDITDLRPNTKYYWRVKALGSTAEKNSGWSRIISFQVKGEEKKPAETSAQENNKGKTLSVIILTIVIFGILFSTFLLIRFLLKRKKMSELPSEELSLGAEPTEIGLEGYNLPSEQNQPPLPNEIYPPKPSLNDISQPPQPPQPSPDIPSAENLDNLSQTEEQNIPSEGQNVNYDNFNQEPNNYPSSTLPSEKKLEQDYPSQEEQSYNQGSVNNLDSFNNNSEVKNYPSSEDLNQENKDYSTDNQFNNTEQSLPDNSSESAQGQDSIPPQTPQSF